MKSIRENQKITLTLEQLKRLVAESRSTSNTLHSKILNATQDDLTILADAAREASEKLWRLADTCEDRNLCDKLMDIYDLIFNALPDVKTYKTMRR